MNSASVSTAVSSTAFSIACSPSSSSTTTSSFTALSSTQLVQQFKPPKSFRFPKRKFGKKGEE